MGCRSYTHNGTLIAWIQRRCVQCGKFLSKKELIHCKRCVKQIARKIQVESSKIYQRTKKGKEVHLKAQKNYRESKNGRLLRNIA